MDLYMQIGVVFLVMTAFAALAYYFAAPAEQFTQGINETNQEIMDRLKEAEKLGISQFHNNTSAPGTSILPVIRDSKARKIAVLVQTKNQQGLVVNYGYQLRSPNNPTVQMSPYATSGVGSTNGTDFEKNFVTTVVDVFNTQASPSAVGSAPMQAPPKTYGQGAGGAMFGGPIATANDGSLSGLLPTGNAVPGITPSGQYFMAPHLMLADPKVPDASQAGSLGRTFSSTGLMYTDQVLKLDAPVNTNFSYAEAQGSLYRFDKNSSYYTTLITDSNSEIIGVYVEEHGVHPNAAVLGSAMLVNGTITQLY